MAASVSALLPHRTINGVIHHHLFAPALAPMYYVLLEEGEDRVSPTGVPIAKKEGMYCQFFVSFLLHQDFLEFTLDRKRDTKRRPFLRI